MTAAADAVHKRLTRMVCQSDAMPRASGLLLVGLVLLTTSGCAGWLTSATADRPGSGSPAAAPAGAPATAPATLPAGPVTVVALGDSLTAGEGDESGQGWVGLLTEAIAASPGREGSTSVNLGASGWDSTMMVDGADGTAGQLEQAVEQARTAGGAVLATVLIGSNDLWYAYENTTDAPTSAAEEDTVVATYRANLDRAVRELRAAGAVVVVGLPDDQSLRPGVADITRLNALLPNVTSEEVTQMSALAKRLAATAAEVAAGHGAATVATDDPFWADPATMADDGIHPDPAGYARLAALWTEGVRPLL